MTLPVEAAGRNATHTFGVLPGLSSEILKGVDLQAILRISTPAPPLHVIRWHQQCCTIGSLAGRTAEEDRQLQEFLRDELAKFETVKGPTDRAQHSIRLIDDTPIKQRYRPRNPAMQAVIDTEVDEMLAQEVIEPSYSPWSSPIVSQEKGRSATVLHRFPPGQRCDP